MNRFALILTILLLPALAWAFQTPAPKAPRIVPDADEKPLYVGVYVYESNITQAAKESGREFFSVLDEHFGILTQHNVNWVHWSVDTPEQFGRVLELAARHNLKLMPQLNFVYFRPNWDAETTAANAARAAEFLNQYKHSPQVLAWSVKEEPYASDVAAYAEYCRLILEKAPGVPLALICHHAGALNALPEDLKFRVLGGDYYYFGWWRQNLPSPQSALFMTRDVTRRLFYPYSQKHRPTDYMLVFTQGGLLQMKLARTLLEKASPELRAAYERLAEKGLSGWRVFEKDGEKKYVVWRCYRMPPNTIRATMWSGVMEGARLLACWSYAPYNSQRMLTPEQAAFSPRREALFTTLAGRPGTDNPQLGEFAQTAAEIRAYERIITRMDRVEDCPVEPRTQNVWAGGFAFPGMDGRIVVLVNANLGEWPHQDHPEFHHEDDVRIDDQGNLVGYKPYTEPLPVRFEATTADELRGVFDLATGKAIIHIHGVRTLPIAPGSGRLIYVGRAEDARRLHALMKTP